VQVANYTDYCVLTDLDVRISVDAGWHPSHLDVFDPRTKQSRIVLFRHNRDCSLSTNLTLATDRQVRPRLPVLSLDLSLHGFIFSHYFHYPLFETLSGFRLNHFDTELKKQVQNNLAKG